MAKVERLWIADQCPECGDDVTVTTDAPPAADGSPQVYSGDRWRCPAGHHGAFYADESTDGAVIELADPQ